MSLTKIYDAPTVFRLLNGIINIFKPAGMKTKQVKNAILYNICRGLNELEERKARPIDTTLLGPGVLSNPFLKKIASTDLIDNLLVTGAHYQISDVRCALVAGLGLHTSGVLLFGINYGLKKTSHIQKNRPIRVYHVTGTLGTGTDTHLPDSQITVRGNYRHVRPECVSSLAASMQASQQRKMYEMCGVDIQSQAAYEIACKGLVRPVDNSQPVIYGIKLIHFQLPKFTLEVHVINESEVYLASIIHEIGIELRSVAHCSAIRCIRHGQFVVEDALLRHGWNLCGIMKNVRAQREVLKEHPYLLEQNNIVLRS